MPIPVAARSKGVGLRPLTCWDCGFESRRGHGCLSVVSVVCCQVEVTATGRSLVQRIPSDCVLLLRVIVSVTWLITNLKEGKIGPIKRKLFVFFLLSIFYLPLFSSVTKRTIPMLK
jgi:hypothetical protein